MTSKELIRKTILEVALFAASQAAILYAVNYWLMSDSKANNVDSSKVASTLEKLGKKGMKLTEHESVIAAEIVHPDDIAVSFSDIGGLDDIVSSLRETVIYPLVYPSLFAGHSSKSAALCAPPKGVLLHGPPGCGKTLLAKALAKESNATFINVPLSVLTNKWYGESNKLVHALFALAKKLAPVIIFLDEIDMFLRDRSNGDHEVTGMMKAEFMTLWDGLLSGPDQILVLGATNRPLDIDPAILRRMPKRFAIGLPDLPQRYQILKLMLPDDFSTTDVSTLAELTAGLSGSDLKELCRDAAMNPVREYMRHNSGTKKDLMKLEENILQIRSLVLADFFVDDSQSVLNSKIKRRGLQTDRIVTLD